jgi:hypothetical protein
MWTPGALLPAASRAGGLQTRSGSHADEGEVRALWCVGGLGEHCPRPPATLAESMRLRSVVRLRDWPRGSVRVTGPRRRAARTESDGAVQCGLRELCSRPPGELAESTRLRSVARLRDRVRGSVRVAGPDRRPARAESDGALQFGLRELSSRPPAELADSTPIGGCQGLDNPRLGSTIVLDKPVGALNAAPAARAGPRD